MKMATGSDGMYYLRFTEPPTAFTLKIKGIDHRMIFESKRAMDNFQAALGSLVVLENG